MITACLLIDLTHRDCGHHDEFTDAWSHDKALIWRLEDVPDGAKVTIDIGNRTMVAEIVVDWLHRHGERLLVEVRGTRSDGVATLVRRARSGEAWQVAS